MLINILKKIINILRKSVVWFVKSSWKKKIVIIVVIIIIGFFASKRLLNNGENGYIFSTVQKRTITEVVSESGAITTNGSVNIYSPTNGVITEVFISNNEEVNVKQKLFTVKSTATSQEKTVAFAAYQAAVSAVQQAENTRRSTTTTVERVHDDVKNHENDETFLQRETRTIAEVAHDNAYEALLVARTQLVSATTTYQATQNATVTTPVSGLISNLSVANGSSVSINSLLTPSSPILMIGGFGITEVVISIGENDVNKIEVNQKAEIKADAINNKDYKGIVKRVDEIGTVTQGVVSFNVYIEIINPDDRLKAGMTVDVDIITNKLEDVLSIPNTAVKPYQKGRAVRKLNNDGEIEFLPVKIGIKGKEFTQIIKGLEEEQEIIMSLTNEKVERKGPFGF